ncbi:DUF943 family protein [Rouxiella sp. Mn2063]|uniref:DUF943 family protein n=1 Tax=Rouxiella sp. Mn2063 TaxID=3395262 RepID=UPI003BE1D529
MRRLLVLIIFIILSVFAYLLWLNNRTVHVIDAHYDMGGAQIIVNNLPITNSAKISWWQHNQQEIRKKYHIPDKYMDPMLITVYAFGNGYQEEGKEDRMCFEDMPPPRNCIDKDILMMIWHNRDGSIKYNF